MRRKELWEKTAADAAEFRKSRCHSVHFTNREPTRVYSYLSFLCLTGRLRLVSLVDTNHEDGIGTGTSGKNS